jgi:hypothetical protein
LCPCLPQHVLHWCSLHVVEHSLLANRLTSHW